MRTVQELEPEFVGVAKSYAGNSDILFYAVNTDEDQSLVPQFVAHEKWDVPTVYADGLDDFMKVDSLPTVMVFDRAGKIIYRINGFPPEGFTENLNTAIQSATGAVANRNSQPSLRGFRRAVIRTKSIGRHSWPKR